MANGQCMWILHLLLLLLLLLLLWDVFYIHVSIYIITIKQSKPEKKKLFYDHVLKAGNDSIC